MHRFTYAFSYERQKLMKQDISFTPQAPQMINKNHFPCNIQIKNKDLHAVYLHWRKKQMLKLHCQTKQTCKSNNTFHKTGSYKSSHHRISCCKFKLCTDIEKNPGPAYICQYIDPSKTTCAPYSQGNFDIFGENAGRQCVPMSLCSLIYNYSNNSITSSRELIEIMNIGNQLYSALSALSRQTYLLLTELPTMVTVQDTDYQLDFTESYTGNLHVSTLSLNENLPFVMPLETALETLLEQSFESFLLTVQCNTVSIFTISNGLLKIFDSHARDSFGMAHPHGTCVLLEVDSVRSLPEYFRSIYHSRSAVIFELKGVKITSVLQTQQLQNINAIEMLDVSTSDINTSLNSCSHTPHENDMMRQSSIPSYQWQCCAVCIYSFCYSTVTRCNYWSDKTFGDCRA
jgi:hypothetical protein